MFDLIPSFLGALAVMAFAWACFLPDITTPAQRVPDRMDRNVFTLTRPLLRLISPLTRFLIWRPYRDWISKKLSAAGLQHALSPEEYFSLRFLLMVVAWLLTGYLAVGPRAAIVVGAFVFPELWIVAAVAQRHHQIRHSMPYVVDLLSLCTGAGLEFGVAVDRVLEKAEKGPLTDELRQSRRDNTLGLPQHEALANMSKRVQLPELTSFVAIVVQAMKLGASVSDILEAQAEKMRLERYEKAERLGAQAQQKILIPLLLFILPAFVILGILPMIIELLRPIIAGGLFGGR